MSFSFRRSMSSLLLVLASAGIGAYTVADWPTLSGMTVGELQQVQVANTEIIKKIGHSAALLYDNSDLIMRYSHWTVGHVNRATFCPECYGTAISNTSEKLIAEINNSPSGVTSNDLVKDSEEIERAVGSINNTIYGQRRALLFSLMRLRNGTCFLLRRPCDRNSGWLRCHKFFRLFQLSE